MNDIIEEYYSNFNFPSIDTLYKLLKANPLATSLFLNCNCWLWYEIGTYSIGSTKEIKQEELEKLIKYGQYKNKNSEKPHIVIQGK